MISNINSRSRATDTSATATSMLKDLSKRDFSDDPYMTFQIGKLTGNNILMTEALKEKAAYSILGPIDEKRDDLMRVIFHEVDAKELWPVATISAAGSVVAAELDKYGFEIINLAYAVESANINALLQDLKKPEVTAAISILPGLNDLIQLLEAAQQEFETAFLQFVDLKIEKEKWISASKLRTIICSQLNEEFIVYLNGMVLSKPDQYKACADVVGMLIANNNSKVQNRLKKPDEEQSSN
jgi:hypothetical protein